MSNPIKSAEMAPVLQSMQDYICNHFTDELMDEVSSAVSLGLVEDLDIDAEGGKPVVQRNESKIIRTEFWRLDCTKLLADIKMRVKIGVSRDHGIPHYVVRYVNFSADTYRVLADVFFAYSALVTAAEDTKDILQRVRHYQLCIAISFGNRAAQFFIHAAFPAF